MEYANLIPPVAVKAVFSVLQVLTSQQVVIVLYAPETALRAVQTLAFHALPVFI